MEWDYAIADNAETPHVSLMRDGEVFLSLPLDAENRNAGKLEELAWMLNNRG